MVRGTDNQNNFLRMGFANEMALWSGECQTKHRVAVKQEVMGVGWHGFSRPTMGICIALWLEVEHDIMPVKRWRKRKLKIWTFVMC